MRMYRENAQPPSSTDIAPVFCYVERRYNGKKMRRKRPDEGGIYHVANEVGLVLQFEKVGYTTKLRMYRENA